MNITDALPIVAGFLAVWVTALINRPGMTPGRKRLIAGGTAAVLGVVSLVAQGAFKELPESAVDTVSTVVVYLGLTIVAGQSFYALMYGPAKDLERATSPKPPEVLDHLSEGEVEAAEEGERPED